LTPASKRETPAIAQAYFSVGALGREILVEGANVFAAMPSEIEAQRCLPALELASCDGRGGCSSTDVAYD